MKNYIPTRIELAIFACTAVVFSAIVYCCDAKDVMLAALSIPLFLGASLAGQIRSGRWNESQQAEPVAADED